MTDIKLSYEITNSKAIKFTLVDNEFFTIVNSVRFYLKLNEEINEFYLSSFNTINTVENDNFKELKINNDFGSLIGSGVSGIIFKSSDEIISKVAFIEDISEEFKNIKSLPQSGLYYNADNIMILKLSKNNINYVLSYRDLVPYDITNYIENHKIIFFMKKMDQV